MWQGINKATLRPNGQDDEEELKGQYAVNPDRCQHNVTRSRKTSEKTAMSDLRILWTRASSEILFSR